MFLGWGHTFISVREEIFSTRLFVSERDLKDVRPRTCKLGCRRRRSTQIYSTQHSSGQKQAEEGPGFPRLVGFVNDFEGTMWGGRILDMHLSHGKFWGSQV